MKNVIISGGSSGIGQAIVTKYCLNAGFRVFNLDIKDNQEFSNLRNYTFIKTDLTIENEIIRALKQITNEYPIIDIVVPNAGKHLSANIENTTTNDLYELINLNLLGAYWLIQNAIPAMKEYGGSIITIGSDQSSIAKNNSAVYGMTKAALAHLTKSTALDYAKYNIRANCLGVGTVDTPLYRDAIARYSERSGIELNLIENSEAQEQPLGRIGQASEVAELVYFLSQDNVSYITGTLIPIDGGYIAR